MYITGIYKIYLLFCFIFNSQQIFAQFGPYKRANIS